MHLSSTAARIGRLFGRLPTLRDLALGSLVAAAVCSPAAHAVVVISPASNIPVPVTAAGVYVNVVSGVTDTNPTCAPGWDLNPYGSASSSFFNPTAPVGRVYAVSIASQVASLALGTVVSVVSVSTLLFGSGAATTTAVASPWVLNASNYFGLRFIGDDTLLHCGCGSMSIGASLQARTVGNLWCESVANTAITVSAVPEVSTSAMLLVGGVMGAVALRRRQA